MSSFGGQSPFSRLSYRSCAILVTTFFNYSYPISRNEYSQESRSYLSNFTMSQVGLVFNSETYPRDRRCVSGSRYLAWREDPTHFSTSNPHNRSISKFQSSIFQATPPSCSINVSSQLLSTRPPRIMFALLHANSLCIHRDLSNSSRQILKSKQ